MRNAALYGDQRNMILCARTVKYNILYMTKKILFADANPTFCNYFKQLSNYGFIQDFYQCIWSLANHRSFLIFSMQPISFVHSSFLQSSATKWIFWRCGVILVVADPDDFGPDPTPE
jgi:hypothetical protein